MKFALFTPHGYEGSGGWAPGGVAGWPAAPDLFEPERALRSHQHRLEISQIADDTRFDQGIR